MLFWLKHRHENHRAKGEKVPRINFHSSLAFSIVNHVFCARSKFENTERVTFPILGAAWYIWLEWGLVWNLVLPNGSVIAILINYQLSNKGLLTVSGIVISCRSNTMYVVLFIEVLKSFAWSSSILRHYFSRILNVVVTFTKFSTSSLMAVLEDWVWCWGSSNDGMCATLEFGGRVEGNRRKAGWWQAVSEVLYWVHISLLTV